MENSNLEHRIASELSEVIEDLPAEKQERIRAIVAVEQQVTLSPIPMPEHMERYEAIQKGLTDRILTMAEEEQKSRHARIEAESRLLNSGLWLGSLLIVFLIAVAVYALSLGAITLAGVILAPIVAIALIYVLRKRPQD